MAADRKEDERENLRRENLRLQGEIQRLRRAVEELSILNELATATGAARDIQEITRIIVRRSLRAIHAEQGVVTLVDEEAPDPMKTFIRTTASSSEHEPLRLDQNLLGWMYLHKKPLLIQDPRRDARFREVKWGEAIRSLLSVPLLVRSELIGILTVYNKKAGTTFTEEDQRLLSIIAAQSAQVIENARLLEEEKKLLRMQEEVRLAYQIQMNLLPKAPPRVPGYDIAGTSLPAQVVGGDYFDFIPVDEHRIALCVGDVVGKGLPASLLMANVQATLRGQVLASASVHECLERTNHLLYQRTGKGAFVTLFYGVLDAARHQFHYANAGHNRPLLLTGNEQPVPLSSGGLVLGAVEEVTYQEEGLTFRPEDLLLVYSDGVTEAMNAAREPFGEERLTALLQQHRHEPARAVIDHVIHAVRQHVGAAPPADDVTLLALKRLP